MNDVTAYRWATAFLVIGATLYYGPLVFAVEAASQDYLGWFVQHFTSNTNPGVALIIMWIGLIGAVGVIGWLFTRIWQSTTRSFVKVEAEREACTTGADSCGLVVKK